MQGDSNTFPAQPRVDNCTMTSVGSLAVYSTQTKLTFNLQFTCNCSRVIIPDVS